MNNNLVRDFLKNKKLVMYVANLLRTTISSNYISHKNNKDILGGIPY